MHHVALTGGIGSGKSLVARILRVLEVPVFEADHEAKRLMAEDADLKSAVVERFGASVYPDDVLDRNALAAVVFNDAGALAELNALVHPVVRKAFTRWALEQKAPYVVMEAAILAETGGHDRFDEVIVVTAPEDLRIKRVMQRDGVGEESVRSRIRNQATEEQRLAIADHFIVNDDRQLVIPQVLEVHRLLVGGA